MDYRFTPEEEAFRRELVSFIKKELPPERVGAEEMLDQSDDTFTLQMRKKLAQRGWLALGWPVAYGGKGASFITQMIFNEEMAYWGCPGRDVMGVGIVGPTLIVYGTEEQKQRFLRPISRGEILWCQGFSEPGNGSDLAGLQTKAQRQGDFYAINGSKIWSSGAHKALWMVLLARTDPSAPKHKGISFFLLDMKTPGITMRPIKSMADMWSPGWGFNQVFFDNVLVPKENLVGGENNGWYVAMTTLESERSSVEYSAIGRRVIEELVQFAHQRRGSEPLRSKLPLLRHRLADIAVEADVSRAMAYHIAWMQQAGQKVDYQASVGKLFGSEMWKRLAQVGMSILGLHGQLVDGQQGAPLRGRIEKMYRTTVGFTIAGGTSEIQRNVIATRGLGLPR